MKNPALTSAPDAHFAIRTITIADLKEALAKGLADFKEMPSHLAFLIVIYPLATLIAGMAAAPLGIIAAGISVDVGFRTHRSACGDRPLRSEPAARARPFRHMG